MRSASVDLPWSMCAMIEKLRILLWSMAGAMVLAAARGLFAREVDESARAGALLDHDRAEPRMPEGHHELVAEPHAHRELVILARDDGALHALLGPDLEADALVERVDLERPRAERELAPVRRPAEVGLLGPRPRQLRRLRPPAPPVRARIRPFVVEHEQAAGLERVVE